MGMRPAVSICVSVEQVWSREIQIDVVVLLLIVLVVLVVLAPTREKVRAYQ